MIKLIRWLAGFVEFSFYGGFCEGFINDCFKLGYNVSDVVYSDGALFAACPAGLYPKLREPAKKNGGRLRLIKKTGLVFCLCPLTKRPGLLAGALSAVIIICALTGFVWNIEITGNEKISQGEIAALMQENGLREGAFKRSLDRGRLESLIMASFPDCAWAHINELGTTMRVEISEGILRPDTVDKREYSNLKAKKDGVLVKATVYDGWAVKNKGDAVTEGDILVSGVYESTEKEMNLFAHAQGEYIAEVKEPITLKISRTQSERVFSSESSYKYLYLFGLKLPLFLSGTEEGEESEEYENVYVGGVKLPLGTVTKTVKSYVVQTRELSDRELQSLAESELENKIETEFSGCEVIKRKLSTSLGADSIEIKGYILCLENIGEEVKIIP